MGYRYQGSPTTRVMNTVRVEIETYEVVNIYKTISIANRMLHGWNCLNIQDNVHCNRGLHGWNCREGTESSRCHECQKCEVSGKIYVIRCFVHHVDSSLDCTVIIR
jgi:hypothetical protein